MSKSPTYSPPRLGDQLFMTERMAQGRLQRVSSRHFQGTFDASVMKASTLGQTALASRLLFRPKILKSLLEVTSKNGVVGRASWIDAAAILDQLSDRKGHFM
ncbi:hypothetical protein ACEPAF_298 [Sanghuangporus sanghuang]